MINSPVEYEKMALVEQKLWWYSILHEKVVSTLKSFKINNQDLIIDLGCGTGGLMQRLIAAGYQTKGIDISATAISFCKKKVLTLPKNQF